MSADYARGWSAVRDPADRQEREKALETILRAVDAGTIRACERDVMPDRLGR